MSAELTALVATVQASASLSERSLRAATSSASNLPLIEQVLGYPRSVWRSAPRMRGQAGPSLGPDQFNHPHPILAPASGRRSRARSLRPHIEENPSRSMMISTRMTMTMTASTTKKTSVRATRTTSGRTTRRLAVMAVTLMIRSTTE